jgi:hypothetical protein
MALTFRHEMCPELEQVAANMRIFAWFLAKCPYVSDEMRLYALLSASRIRAQLLAPLWKLSTSYFSFGL